MGNAFDMFTLDIGLTDKGEKDYQQVMKFVYMFINEIKKEGVKDFLYDELKRKSEMQFANEKKMSPMETANELSKKLNANL